MGKRRRQSSAGLESFRINGSLILPLEVGKCGIKSSCGRGSTPRSFSLLWNYSCRGEGEENPRLDMDQGQKLDFPSVLSRVWGFSLTPVPWLTLGAQSPPCWDLSVQNSPGSESSVHKWGDSETFLGCSGALSPAPALLCPT